MNKLKTYIFGIALLSLGILLGYLIKPSSSFSSDNHHNHDHTERSEELVDSEIWTCSMHPQIRQNEKGICPICEMDLIPLDNSFSNDDPTILKMSKSAAKLAQIETFVVGGQYKTQDNVDFQEKIKVDGEVEMDERSLKSQTAHLSGRIEKISVNFEGQFVSKGQNIARIYSTDLLAASQELLTATQFDDRIEGLKDAAIQKLKNWKISQNQIDEILSTGVPIETINIYADHSGYVMNKNISLGDYVTQGQSIYTLGSISRVWLIFHVFESDLANVKKGNKISFTSSSVPNKEFNAKINYIDPTLNIKTRTARVRAEISNPSNLLKPGMLLKANIEASQKSQDQSEKSKTISIPNSAILWTGEKSVVYVQLDNMDVPTFQFREVIVANRSEGFSTILKGLDQGERVVTQGAFSVDAAAQLNNSFSMMNRNVTIKKDSNADENQSFLEETPALFKEQLDQLISSYIQLKDALVNTDQNEASLKTEAMLETLKHIDMELLSGEAHLYWMEQLKGVQAHGKKIQETTDVEEQRNQFDFLSQSIIKSLKAFGTNDKVYYVQYCPMVKDNTGADWLSTEQQIRNPYFGDKMMKCGSVKLELN